MCVKSLYIFQQGATVELLAHLVWLELHSGHKAGLVGDGNVSVLVWKTGDVHGK